jgi:hypothetical protein
MESINVVVDDEEIGALKNGEKSQPADTPLEASGLITGTFKPPSSPQDEQASPSQVPSPQKAVLIENPARNSNCSQDELDPPDLPKEPLSCVKLNHPQRQLIRDINEGLQLRNIVVNQVSYTCYLS